MTHDITPSLGRDLTCPYSGLPITTKPEWHDIQVGRDYTLSYGIIGDRILFTVPKGNIRTVNIDQALNARSQVIEEYFGESDPEIVEIRDFNQVHGIPSHETRKFFRKSLGTSSNQKGLFVINVSWIIQTVFVSGLRLHNTPFPLKLSHSYATALAEARNLTEVKDQTEWCTQTSSVKVVHQIINNTIIFTQAEGQLVKEDIPKLLSDYEQLICSETLGQGPIYRIADYTKVTKGDWKGRLLLAQGLNRIHISHDRIPVVMVVYGLTPVLHTAMGLATKIIKNPIYFAKNKEEAFAHIKELQQNKEVTLSSAPNKKSPQEVEDILRFISTIIWDDAEEKIPKDFANKPLEPISDALFLVKQDVFELLQEAKARTSEIAEKNKQLEKEVKRRKSIEKQLNIAIEQAEAATQAKGDFLATMSHEIRTPMNGILGMIHLLGNTDLSHEQRKYLEISNDSATSLLKLINNILDFSKVDQNQLQIEVTPFNLAELCTTCCTLFSNDIQKKSLELHCHTDPELNQYIIGDPGKLRQILINLLHNAIKFTPSGSITLRTEFHQQSPQLGTIKFSITDTGIGISKDKIKSIFDTFAQANSSTTRQYGGTGLGLAISRKICQFMEGDLQVSSTHKGTTFFFTLPFGLGDAIPETHHTASTHYAAKASTEDIRILIVEDEPINQLFAEALLDQFGYEHDHANNGIEALEAIKKQPYHIILMDCQMPVMDGYEATAKIRAMQSNGRRQAIIALTAHAMEGDRERCLECGMDDYLAKPIVPALLLETIEKYLPQAENSNND